MEKLITMSKKLDHFFKVMQKIIVIGMTVAVLVILVLTIANMVDPNAVIGEGFNIVNIGPVTIELDQEAAPTNATILTYTWAKVLLGGIAAAFIYFAFGLIRKVLQPMTEGRPFDRKVGQNIRKIAYVSVGLGIVQNIGSMIDTMAAVKAFSLSSLADSGTVQAITANYTFDLSFLILFFVLLLMSHVFSYGAELQQLSDETL